MPMGEVEEFPKRCPRCRQRVKPPNKLIDWGNGSSECALCFERQQHKEIVEYLEGKRSGIMFMCSKIGDEDGFCDIIVPQRDYLSLYSTEELRREIAEREG